MWSDPRTRDAPGLVLAVPPHPGERFSEHERCTLLGFVQKLAALRGDVPAGFHCPARRGPGRAYFVPHRTLTAEEAAALGISGPEDLFGGVVPQAFVATKAISPGLVDPAARAVPGWNPRFSAQAQACVLRGYTVFDIAGADHALADQKWQQNYTSLLVHWMTEMVLNARAGRTGAAVATPLASSAQETPRE